LSLRHRHYLKGRRTQETLEEMKNAIPSLDIDDLKERQIEVASLDTDKEIYLVEGKPAFLRTEKGLFPTLVNREMIETLPTITVDAGAVSHICNGSALMAPGIVKIRGKFSKDSIVAVDEETYGKTIALVKALFGSEEMVRTKKGRVATNFHYVGDKLWKAYRNLL